MKVFGKLASLSVAALAVATIAMSGGAQAQSDPLKVGFPNTFMTPPPLWVENMTAGRGWIALALVVFASWRPWRAFFGAYLFGGITIIQLHAQGFGVDVPSQILSMLPYLATIIVLVLISRDDTRARYNAPACLGRSFHASG